MDTNRLHLYVWHLKKNGYTRAVHKEIELENNIFEDGLKHDIIKLIRVVMDQKFHFMGQTYGQHEGLATGAPHPAY
jgi:hypothetical protein